METLLAHIRETTGKPTRSASLHPMRALCGACLKVAYCGMDCQTSHWHKEHKYECIGVGQKRLRDEEELIDLSRLRDLWGIISPWLGAEDLKNLRLASPEIERQIRLTYFKRFRVGLTNQAFIDFNPDIAPFITKVDDSESGGRLALWIARAQNNTALRDVRITNCPRIDWKALTQLVNLTKLGLYNNQLTALPESFGNLVNLTELLLYDNQLTALPESFLEILSI